VGPRAVLDAAMKKIPNPCRESIPDLGDYAESINIMGKKQTPYRKTQRHCFRLLGWSRCTQKSVVMAHHQSAGKIIIS
jgi:hypothetical protein